MPEPAGKVAPAPVPAKAASVVPITPRPISDFNDSGLRESVEKALAWDPVTGKGVPPGHGNALINIDNNGAGLMFVQRFDDRWALVVATRYSFKDGGSAQAAVQVSW